MTSSQDVSENGPGTNGAVVLASASTARAGLLRNTGVPVEIQPAGVDEAALKLAMQAEHAPARDIAMALAELKAVRVSQRRPMEMVIGADQVLVCDGQMFDKPGDLDAARETLRQLRGRTHELLSAVVVARGGAVIWRHIDSARLQMRDYSDAFIDAYLRSTGDGVLASVGAYQLEGFGVQLFNRVDGDYFVILGLPLLPLLDFLRGHGIVQR